MNKRRTIGRWVCACAGLMLCAGCGIGGTEASVDRQMRAATGMAIEFKTVGEPVDVELEHNGALTMEDATTRALEHSPDVQAALAQVRVGLAEARQSRLLPNPVLSVVVRIPEGGGSTQIEAGLSAELLSLLQMPRRVSAADNQLRATSAEALTAAIDVVSEVQETFATAQAAEAQIAVLHERRRIIEKLVELARARLEIGESSRLDVTALELQRVMLEVEITQAASQMRQEKLALARLMGEPASRAEWELEQWGAIDVVTLDEGAWVEAALEHRPEIQAKTWELAALGDEAALTQLALLDGAEIGVEGEREEDWAIGPALAIPLPIFDWGQQRRAKAEAQRISARHELTDIRRQVVEDVRRALETQSSAQDALRQVETKLLPLSDERLAQTENAYTNGSADVTDVLLAQQEAQEARAKQIELQKDVTSARIALYRAAGGPNIAPVIPSNQPTTQAPAIESEQP